MAEATIVPATATRQSVSKAPILDTRCQLPTSEPAHHTARTKPAPTAELDTQPRRQWLTEVEVEAIIKACGSERDKLMVLMAYRHGLRVSELIRLTWRQVDLDGARLIALNMALNGESRADTDRYLAENFELADREKLIDEVYAAIEG